LNEALRTVIEELYAVFSAHRMPAHVEMSPYRDPERELGALRRLPLRGVPASGLEAYAAHAVTTVGDGTLLRYALPRLLELTARNELATSEEIVLGKLAAAGWDAWPERERAVVRAFLNAWWAYVLNAPVEPGDRRAVTTLSAIAQTSVSLADFLRAWEERSDITAGDHLASAVNALYDTARAEFVTSDFWDARPGHGAQLRVWLARPETLTRLEKGERRVREREDQQLVEVYAFAVAALRVVLGARRTGEWTRNAPG